ncbi:MAG: hypothetical protein HY759_06360 [Nitrospirae bacterium]|nr:hypothetical protein [Nitrospirota bacterium]
MIYLLNCRSLIILSALLFVFIGCTEQKTNLESKQDSYIDLTRLLGADISTTIKNGIITIEYCPDNTCESFSMPRGNPKEKLIDFVYLYLYFISDYHVLDDFRKKIKLEQVTKIIQHNIQDINKQTLLKNAKDVMKTLVDKYQIKGKFVRYDEFKRNEVDIDIKSRLEKLKQ